MMTTAVLLGCAALGVWLLVHRNIWWPTRVYYLRSGTGRLLYVGKSNNLRLRLGQHACDPRKRAWWPDVDLRRTTSVRYSNRIVASVVEAVAIVVRRPAHNKEWNWLRRY